MHFRKPLFTEFRILFSFLIIFTVNFTAGSFSVTQFSLFSWLKLCPACLLPLQQWGLLKGHCRWHKGQHPVPMLELFFSVFIYIPQGTFLIFAALQLSFPPCNSCRHRSGAARDIGLLFSA